MDRSTFIFALKTRYAGDAAKETLIGLKMNQIFDGINELARIGIHLELHEDEAPAGDAWPAWAVSASGLPDRLVESQSDLDALGDGWSLKQSGAPIEPAVQREALFSSGGPASERRVSDVEHASGTVAPRAAVDAVQRTDIDEHPAVSLHGIYSAPQGAMTGAEMLNQSQVTRRAQQGIPTPEPLNSPETGNVERQDATSSDDVPVDAENDHADVS
jgi:hypothetical protein